MTAAQLTKAAREHLTAIAVRISDIVEEIGLVEIRLGVVLSEAFDEYQAAPEGFFVSLPVADKVTGVEKLTKLPTWRDYAEALVPGTFSGSLYALKDAGAVARVLGEQVGEAKKGTLKPMYRLLSVAKTDEERESAENLVRETWAKALEGAKDSRPPTGTAVEKLVDRVQKGTRGPARKAAKSATATRNAPTAGEGENEVTVTLDPAAIEAANRIVSSFVKKAAKDHAIETGSVRAIMLGTIRLVTEHGRDAIAATLK